MFNLYFVFIVDEIKGRFILFFYYRGKGGNFIRNVRKLLVYVCFEGIEKYNLILCVF